eukprot:148787_1
MYGRKYCLDCSSYHKNHIYASIELSDIKQHIYCIKCRKQNAETIRERIKNNNIKAEIMRNELLLNPRLERDLLCNMERKSALDSLINDINKLTVAERCQWILIVMDMDYLKAWNSCIGHVSTDKLIQRIGNIMNKYVSEINNGKWINESLFGINESLSHAFIYRIGGDEFVMAIKCDGSTGARDCRLYNFYNKF